MKIIFQLLMILCFIRIGFSQTNSYELREDQIRIINKRNIFVQRYADFLNFFKTLKNNKIPIFFLQHHLDRKNTIVKIEFHNPYSLRKLIIDKITNKQLLQFILDSKDRRLKKKPKIPKKTSPYESVFPFQEFSSYELVKYHYQAIVNENYIGKNASNYPN